MKRKNTYYEYIDYISIHQEEKYLKKHIILAKASSKCKYSINDEILPNGMIGNIKIWDLSQSKNVVKRQIYNASPDLVLYHKYEILPILGEKFLRWYFKQYNMLEEYENKKEVIYKKPASKPRKPMGTI